jgi:hypothetical protein
MYSITSLYHGVGMIRAEYFTIKNEEMRLRTIQASSPSDEEYSRVVSIVNLTRAHWQAFYVDLAANVCILYDPPSDDMASVCNLKNCGAFGGIVTSAISRSVSRMVGGFGVNFLR